MNEADGRFIHLATGQEPVKGPFETLTMEDYAGQGIIDADTKVSHNRHTRGRVVEARRIARFFNIFANVKDTSELSLRNPTAGEPALNLGVSQRAEEVSGIGRFMADGKTAWEKTAWGHGPLPGAR